MALENKYQITVNTKTKMFRQVPEVVANDNVTFEITVYDDTVLFPLASGYTYQLVSLKLSGKSVIRAGTGDLTTNKITFTLGSSEMLEPGKVEATVQIFDSSMKRISTAKFDYVVRKDPSLQGGLPTDDKTLVIANESLLNDAIAKSNQASTDSTTALTKATAAETNSTEALTTANDVKDQFDQVVAEAGSNNPEVVLARGGETTLGARLDKFTSNLADKTNKTDGYISIKAYDNLKVAIAQGYDWQPAIQQAITDSKAQGKIVLIPPGVTYVSNPIRISSYVKLLGFGKGISTIKPTGAFPAIIIDGNSTTGVYGWEVSGISLDGNSVGTIGIDIEYAREGFIKNCAISGFQKGVTANQSWTNNIEFCEIKSNSDKNVELGDQSNAFNLIGCHLDNAGNIGLHVTADSQMVNILGGTIQNCGLEGIRLSAGRAVNINGCYLEKNNTSNTANTANIGILGDAVLVEGVVINGGMNWNSTTTAGIIMDKASGVSINGNAILTTTGATTQYSIVTSTNTQNVFISGEYKETLAYNDLGSAIMNIANPTFYKSGGVKRDYATWTIETPTMYHDPVLNFTSAGVVTQALTSYGYQSIFNSKNGSNGTMEKIWDVHSNNLYMGIYKKLTMNGNQLSDFYSDSGTTAQRPTPRGISQLYFDTTLGKPIWVKQVSPAIWVDATGTTV